MAQSSLVAHEATPAADPAVEHAELADLAEFESCQVATAGDEERLVSEGCEIPEKDGQEGPVALEAELSPSSVHLAVECQTVVVDKADMVVSHEDNLA